MNNSNQTTNNTLPIEAEKEYLRDVIGLSEKEIVSLETKTPQKKLDQESQKS